VPPVTWTCPPTSPAPVFLKGASAYNHQEFHRNLPSVAGRRSPPHYRLVTVGEDGGTG